MRFASGARKRKSCQVHFEICDGHVDDADEELVEGSSGQYLGR